jgi:hypothetical protein
MRQVSSLLEANFPLPFVLVLAGYAFILLIDKVLIDSHDTTHHLPQPAKVQGEEQGASERPQGSIEELPVDPDGQRRERSNSELFHRRSSSFTDFLSLSQGDEGSEQD